MWEIMPVNQVLLHANNISNIYFCLSLYKYLDTQTMRNIGEAMQYNNAKILYLP